MCEVECLCMKCKHEWKEHVVFDVEIDLRDWGIKEISFSAVIKCPNCKFEGAVTKSTGGIYPACVWLGEEGDISLSVGV